MALLDLWNADGQQITTKRIDQLIAFLAYYRLLEAGTFEAVAGGGAEGADRRHVTGDAVERQHRIRRQSRLHSISGRLLRRRQVRPHRRLPNERHAPGRQQPEMGPPLVLMAELPAGADTPEFLAEQVVDERARLIDRLLAGASIM